MTIHFYPERKKLKSPERTIYAYIRGLANKKTIILNTGEKIDLKHWDKRTERAIHRGKNKYKGAFELNAFLNAYEEDIRKAVRQVRTDNPIAGYEEIEMGILEKFGKIKSSQFNFFEALEQFLIVRKNDLTVGSLRKFKTLQDHLKEFEKEKIIKINFHNIKMSFYDEFRAFLLEDKGMINNSAYKMIGILKNFLNWAYERGYNKNLEFQRFKLREDSVDIITLDTKELKAMQEFNFTGNERLDRARDLFVFGCYTGGRFSDLVNIERSDIRHGSWLLRTKKTRDIMEIPLTDAAIQILEKYKEQPFPLPRISNQKLNKYIKEVAKKVELDELIRIVQYKGSEAKVKVKPKHELISTHTARRTFITQSLNRGMKAEIIMRITGHKSFKTFKKYLNLTSKDIRNELNKAWN